MDFVRSPAAIRRWCVASLLANMALVVTGGAVRLTGSGLGCPTWPQCEPGTYVPHPESGLHGVIEFGNRLLTFVLAAIAIGTMISAWRAHPDTRLRGLAVVAFLGIPLQAVVGGWSVLTQLNPWVVSLHLLLSIGIIAVCVAMVHRAFGLVGVAAPARLTWLIRALVVVGTLVVWLGTVVTGAGPHAGDGGAQRSGLDPALTARVHAGAVWTLLALTVVAFIAARGTLRLRRALLVLLVVMAGQGLVGYLQYFTALPAALVAVHMLGTALFTAALAHTWLSARPPRIRTAADPGRQP